MLDRHQQQLCFLRKFTRNMQNEILSTTVSDLGETRESEQRPLKKKRGKQNTKMAGGGDRCLLLVMCAWPLMGGALAGARCKSWVHSLSLEVGHCGLVMVHFNHTMEKNNTYTTVSSI